MQQQAFDKPTDAATAEQRPGEATAGAASPMTARSAAWAGYAACAWAFVFAALSFYWAAGGTAGVSTNAPAITRPVLARDPTWIAILWGTGALKIIAGLLALALVRPWGRALPRWLLLTAAWGAGAMMAGYEGAASLVQHALMVVGVVSTPAGLGPLAARWHLVLWDPWWLIGGILFCLTAWHYSRQSRAVRSGDV
ncbi:MAG: DUF3995 domain-containing protein [Thermomicrobiales bacterium]